MAGQELMKRRLARLLDDPQEKKRARGQFWRYRPAVSTPASSEPGTNKEKKKARDMQRMGKFAGRLADAFDSGEKDWVTREAHATRLRLAAAAGSEAESGAGNQGTALAVMAAAAALIPASDRSVTAQGAMALTHRREQGPDGDVLVSTLEYGTVVEERIYHEAGATTPQAVERAELLRWIRDAGRIPVERDTIYNELWSEDAEAQAQGTTGAEATPTL